MYFFYVDESGEKNPTVKKDEPYVLLALGFHEYQWKKFERAINAFKLKLIRDINHSSDIRIPKNRERHPFLQYLKKEELSALIDLFYNQLEERHIHVFVSVIDKACLDSFMDTEKLHRKAYELLLERVENFLFNEHPNQQAIFVLDNTSKQLNRSLAMKHSFFQRTTTSSGVRLKHIVEIPFFVESYLSNGVQLADLCAYNIYKTFNSSDEKYDYFLKILPYFNCRTKSKSNKVDGLKVFPDNHRWKDLIEKIENERARLIAERAQK